MTENDARAWVGERFGAEAVGRLSAFANEVIAENVRQNLISPASVEQIWVRHIVDSLQLVALAQDGPWLDVGTGGGFPGLAIALVRDGPMMLVEPRRKRAEFLQRCVDILGLAHVEISARKVEQVTWPATTISARAVTSIENLLRAAGHCATPSTQWLLPRGAVDGAELTQTARRHGLMFHVEHSVTQAGSAIVVLNAR